MYVQYRRVGRGAVHPLPPFITIEADRDSEFTQARTELEALTSVQAGLRPGDGVTRSIRTGGRDSPPRQYAAGAPRLHRRYQQGAPPTGMNLANDGADAEVADREASHEPSRTPSGPALYGLPRASGVRAGAVAVLGVEWHEDLDPRTPGFLCRNPGMGGSRRATANSSRPDIVPRFLLTAAALQPILDNDQAGDELHRVSECEEHDERIHTGLLGVIVGAIDPDREHPWAEGQREMALARPISIRSSCASWLIRSRPDSGDNRPRGLVITSEFGGIAMRHEPRPMPSTPERLAYWYFRLNGFMTIENFVVHPERGSNVCTDVDILAARFKYRSENGETPMLDDPKVTDCDTLVNVILAEIKKRDCALNESWRPEAGNMQRVLRAIGCAIDDELESASGQLYRVGRWSNDSATVRLFALGERVDDDLKVGPEQQIEWSSVIDFCIRRFLTYQAQKQAVVQWTSDGRELQKLALLEDASSIRSYFGLPTV